MRNSFALMTARALFFMGLLLIACATGAQSTDELKRLRTRVKAADSSLVITERIAARLELAESERPSKAIGLLNEAALIADSARLTPLALDARTRLRDLYASGKDWKHAYEQALLVHGLAERRDAASAGDAMESAFAEIERAAGRADSLEAVLQRERLAAAEALESAGRERRTWSNATLAAVVFGVLALLVLWLNGRGRERRWAGELNVLRARIEELEKPRNRAREDSATPEPVRAEALPPASMETPSAVIDPEVLAHVRRRAPERLATFRDARGRGDLEKAVRVVHTLKPLLVGLDEPRFGPLCARLVASGATASPAWESDADALEHALDGVLSADPRH